MSTFPSGPFGYQPAQPLQYESRVNSTTLSTFFNAVYAWMAVGLALTGGVAWYVGHNAQAMATVFRPGIIIPLFIAELVLVMAISWAVNKISASVATVLFLIYSALTGLTLSGIFVMYTGQSIAATFIVTAAMFGAMSLWGFFTKTDLTRFGSLFFMALIGLIVAMLVNIFLHSSGLAWIISIGGVLIFVGLTAYDTQKLRMIATSTASDPSMSARLSISGALMLYLDFLNLFLMLLQLMGNRRQD